MFLQQQFSDEVTISSLPHPISMFLLGIMAVTVIFVLIENKRTRSDLKVSNNKLNEVEKLLELVNKRTDDKISDISKKIDSRVDKAILAIKKVGDNKR
jgi:F0F1-type ATP synthase membrane subunit a